MRTQRAQQPAPYCIRRQRRCICPGQREQPSGRGCGAVSFTVLLDRVHGRRAGEAGQKKRDSKTRNPLPAPVGTHIGAGARGRAAQRGALRIRPFCVSVGLPGHVCGLFCCPLLDAPDAAGNYPLGPKTVSTCQFDSSLPSLVQTAPLQVEAQGPGPQKPQPSSISLFDWTLDLDKERVAGVVRRGSLGHCTEGESIAMDSSACPCVQVRLLSGIDFALELHASQPRFNSLLTL